MITTDLAAALFAWAVELSGLPAHGDVPSVVPLPHARLEALACRGGPCKVIGWYPRGGGDIVYIDDRIDPQADTWAASVVVHEFVHVLQARSGAADTCENAIAFERVAYAAQTNFLVRYGIYHPVGAIMHSIGCEPTNGAPAADAGR